MGCIIPPPRPQFCNLPLGTRERIWDHALADDWKSWDGSLESLIEMTRDTQQDLRIHWTNLRSGHELLCKDLEARLVKKQEEELSKKSKACTRAAVKKVRRISFWSSSNKKLAPGKVAPGEGPVNVLLGADGKNEGSEASDNVDIAARALCDIQTAKARMGTRPTGAKHVKGPPIINRSQVDPHRPPVPQNTNRDEGYVSAENTVSDIDAASNAFDYPSSNENTSNAKNPDGAAVHIEYTHGMADSSQLKEENDLASTAIMIDKIRIKDEDDSSSNFSWTSCSSTGPSRSTSIETNPERNLEETEKDLEIREDSRRNVLVKPLTRFGAQILSEFHRYDTKKQLLKIKPKQRRRMQWRLRNIASTLGRGKASMPKIKHRKRDKHIVEEMVKNGCRMS